ncbi:MAG: hypothetical protein WCK02_08045 [Bacteroidota bacterium]
MKVYTYLNSEKVVSHFAGFLTTITNFQPSAKSIFAVPLPISSAAALINAAFMN